MLSIVQQERSKNNGWTASTQTKYKISSNAQNDKHMLDKWHPPVRTPTRSIIHLRCTINRPVDEVTESIWPNSIQPKVQRRCIQHKLIAYSASCLMIQLQAVYCTCGYDHVAFEYEKSRRVNEFEASWTLDKKF